MCGALFIERHILGWAFSPGLLYWRDGIIVHQAPPSWNVDELVVCNFMCNCYVSVDLYAETDRNIHNIPQVCIKPSAEVFCAVSLQYMSPKWCHHLQYLVGPYTYIQGYHIIICFLLQYASMRRCFNFVRSVALIERMREISSGSESVSIGGVVTMMDRWENGVTFILPAVAKTRMIDLFKAHAVCLETHWLSWSLVEIIAALTTCSL